jgi:hypothetical protein
MAAWRKGGVYDDLNFRGPRPDSRAQAISPRAAGTTGVATEGEGAKTAVGMQARVWLAVGGKGVPRAMLRVTEPVSAEALRR